LNTGRSSSSPPPESVGSESLPELKKGSDVVVAVVGFGIRPGVGFSRDCCVGSKVAKFGSIVGPDVGLLVGRDADFSVDNVVGCDVDLVVGVRVGFSVDMGEVAVVDPGLVGSRVAKMGISVGFAVNASLGVSVGLLLGKGVGLFAGIDVGKAGCILNPV